MIELVFLVGGRLDSGFVLSVGRKSRELEAFDGVCVVCQVECIYAI